MNEYNYLIKILTGVSEINPFLSNAQKSPLQQGDTSLYTGCGLISMNKQTLLTSKDLTEPHRGLLQPANLER